MYITDQDQSTLGLLFNEAPLLIRKELAVRIGLNEAIVLQQVHFHIQNKYKSVKEKDRADDRAWQQGTFWTYNTFEEWQENDFPFWSVRTLKRIFKKMEDDGILQSGKFNKMKTDQTKWYTINYEKLRKNVDVDHSDNLAQCAVDHSDNLAQCAVDHSDNLAPSIVTDCPEPKCQLGTMLPKTIKEVLKDSSSSASHRNQIDSELRSKYPETFDRVRDELLADETVIIETDNQYKAMLLYRLKRPQKKQFTVPAKQPQSRKPVRKEPDPDELFSSYKSNKTATETTTLDEITELMEQLK